MLMEELQTIDTPLSDFSAGFAMGAGVALGILSVACATIALTGC